MKSRDGKSHRREKKKKKKKIKEEKVRIKKIQEREIGKSRNTAFIQWFAAPEGRKVGSLQRQVRSQLAKWKKTNCTLLWRETLFQVKHVKALWELPCWKSARRCGAKHIWKSKCTKHLRCWKSARLHCIALDYTTIIKLHYVTLQ